MRSIFKNTVMFALIASLLSGCGTTSPFVADLEAGTPDAVMIRKLDSGELKPNEDLTWQGHAYGRPLDNAIHFGRTELVRELVKRGADVNYPGFQDELPFNTAIRRQQFASARILLEFGATVPGGIQEQLVLAIQALDGGVSSNDPFYPEATSIKLTRMVLEKMTKAGVVPKPDSLRQLTNHYWAKYQSGRIAKYPLIGTRFNEALRLLLDAGADPWVVEEPYKLSPFVSLTSLGKYADEPIKIMVNAAVESRLRTDKSGASRDAIRREYVNRCPPVAANALMAAVAHNNLSAISALGQLGADPNKLCPATVSNATSGDTYSDHMSALHFAVAQNKMPIAKALVGFGGNTELRTGSGKTIDQLAAISREFNERADAATATRTAEAQQRAAEEARQRQADRDQAARERETNIKGAVAILGAAALGNVTRNYSEEQRSALVDAYVRDVAEGTGGSNLSATADQVQAQRKREYDAQAAELNALRSQSSKITPSKQPAQPTSDRSWNTCGPTNKCLVGDGYQSFCSGPYDPNKRMCQSECSMDSLTIYHDTTLAADKAYIGSGTRCPAGSCNVINSCN